MPKKKNPGNGRYERNIDTDERNAKAARLRANYRTWQEIADELGYSSPGHAYNGVQSALKATVQEAADDLRKVELERLDSLARAAEEVLRKNHIMVSQGRIVRWGEEDGDQEGQPVRDDGPVLAAIDRLLKVSSERRKLLGLDAPTKQEITGKVATYKVDGVDLDALR